METIDTTSQNVLLAVFNDDWMQAVSRDGDDLDVLSLARPNYHVWLKG